MENDKQVHAKFGKGKIWKGLLNYSSCLFLGAPFDMHSFDKAFVRSSGKGFVVYKSN